MHLTGGIGQIEPAPAHREKWHAVKTSKNRSGIAKVRWQGDNHSGRVLVADVQTVAHAGDGDEKCGLGRIGFQFFARWWQGHVTSFRRKMAPLFSYGE